MITDYFLLDSLNIYMEYTFGLDLQLLVFMKLVDNIYMALTLLEQPTYPVPVHETLK